MATIITKDSLRSSVEAATGGLCTVLYDDAGHPSFMRRIPKMRIEDLYPDLGLTGTHPAFIVNGVEKGVEYVANLIIPPVRYEDVPLPVTLEEPELPEDLDPACLTSVPTTERVRVPLAAEEMEAVRLILWTVTDNMEA